MDIKQRARAEATAMAWRARYWARQSKRCLEDPRIVPLTPLPVLLLLFALAKLRGDVGSFLGTSLVAKVLCIGLIAFTAAVALAMALPMLRQVWRNGKASPEKAKLEEEIAVLRGEAFARKEAEELMATLEAAKRPAANAGEPEKIEKNRHATRRL
jgi:hypothetical protein